MKKLFFFFGVIISLITVVHAQTNSAPPLVGNVPGAAAFNPNGLSFTNVHYKIALGSEIQTAGTFVYAQSDEDLWSFRNFDLGLGQEATMSTSGNGLHSAAVDVEGIKNFDNWQLVGKVGYGRNIEGNTGNFLRLGFDVNYNLTRGAGLGLLGTSGGSFTYVFAGVSYANSDFQFDAAHTERMFHVGIGWAF